MRAAIIRAPFLVEVAEVPDPVLVEPTDAIVRDVLTCICGSDLWGYRGIHEATPGAGMGHEFLGIVEELGSAVRTLRRGDLIVAPFLLSDGECIHCRSGLLGSCANGSGWGWNGVDGGQCEYARVPLADSTRAMAPPDVDEARLPALLTLSDVICTGHHAARSAGVA